MRILAVDDDPIIHDLLRDGLASQNNIDLTCVESAEDALEVLHGAEKPFDTFLLDILLPGTDGIELCRDIRALEEHRTTPIIMITASRQPEQMQRAFDAGATDYVTKPFDSLELSTRVKLAAMLNETMQRDKRSQRQLEELNRLTRIEFEDRLALGNVDGFLDMLEIENQLLRSTGACYAMSLIAVEMTGAQIHFNSVTPAQFRHDIQSVGSAIVESMPADRTRIAYAGRGVFIAIQHGRKRVDVKALETEMARNLGSIWHPLSDTARGAPHLRTVEISTNRLWSGLAASDTLKAYLDKRKRVPTVDHAEEAHLFAAMRKRMFLPG